MESINKALTEKMERLEDDLAKSVSAAKREDENHLKVLSACGDEPDFARDSKVGHIEFDDSIPPGRASVQIEEESEKLDEKTKSRFRTSDLTEDDTDLAVQLKQRKFLLKELKKIKESLHGKILFFKARTQGKTSSHKKGKQFEINEDISMEQFIKMEIDHLFAIHKVLNSVVLQGDETFRVMQELAKLTNDHD
jgi:hypothetical protein